MQYLLWRQPAMRWLAGLLEDRWCHAEGNQWSPMLACWTVSSGSNYNNLSGLNDREYMLMAPCIASILMHVYIAGCMCKHIVNFFLNHLRISSTNHSLFLLDTLVLFPKNVNILFHNPITVIIFYKCNIDRIFFWIYHSYFNFVNWPNNVI